MLLEEIRIIERLWITWHFLMEGLVCLIMSISLGKANFSVVFFIGDFNYRINVTYEEALEAIEKEDWDMLYNFDQVFWLKFF